MTIRTIRRRRREAKTDYKARFSLLKSGKPRLVVRKSNRYILVQLVSSDLAQDKVLASVSSKELVEKGWPKEKIGSLKSVHAAYLTGFLLAKTMKGKQPEAIFDMGMYPNVHGSRIYAALRGAGEGLVEIPHMKNLSICHEKILLADFTK
jgi:large subunit ribosomal protein L18